MHVTVVRCALLSGAALAAPLLPVAAARGQVVFGVIGDYGESGAPELAVANRLKSWNPDFVITTGDNNYPDGAQATIDANIGRYYADYIYPYAGTYPRSADAPATNRFFPSLGNHDWRTAGATPYLNYFTLPGNERYYDFVRGPVHFYVVDSDPHEVHGTSPGSPQGQWLKGALAAATEPFKVVYFHHAPYSSSNNHGSQEYMQWPFEKWGATAVLNGHDHVYERLQVGTIPYFVNGAGGDSRYGFTTPVPGSQVRYTGDWGAMKVTATSSQMTFEFYNTTSPTPIDSFTQPAPAPASPLPPTATATFRRGLAGSTVRDTYVDAANPTVSNGAGTIVVVDNSPVNQGLLRFDNLFADTGGPVPNGARIVSAMLSFTTGTAANNQSAGQILVHRMLRNWDEGSTYAGLTNGVSVDGVEAIATPDGALIPNQLGLTDGIDVTAALQLWSDGLAPNYGWLLRTTVADGWRWRSSEYATASLRPTLSVTYEIPEPASAAVAGLAATLASRRPTRRRRR